MEEIKILLEKLMYCKGIGNLGRLKVLSYCRQANVDWLSKEEIIYIAKIDRYQELFCKSWEEAEKKRSLSTRSFLTILDEAYPAQLREIYNPPAVLFFSGNLDLLKQPSLAIVGSREASSYAGEVLQKILPDLAAQGLTIVSGLAKGVDSLAHKLAISYHGSTIGVVGNGLDQSYPKEVYYLQEKMKRTHLVLSEYVDGTFPSRHHFPMRNRIIAGLTFGTCVIEARQRSGSLITAQLASEFGREVFAVPGEVLKGQSNGCLELIQDGAKCVISAQDILNELPSFKF